MLNLFDMFARAQGGAAMDAFSRQFRLTPQQTEAAVEALLPAFLLGLRQMASSPEGLVKLSNLMAQSSYQSLLSNPAAAFGAPGEQAGNEALSTIFGSKEMTRAIADQAAQFAGIGPAILQKMLPLMAAMLMGGLSQSMRPGQGGMADMYGEMLKHMTGHMTGAAAAPDRQAPSEAGQDAPQADDQPKRRKSAGPSGLDDLSKMSKTLDPSEDPGQALFGNMIEAGRNIQQAHMDNMQRVFEAFLGKSGRDRS